jgi:hypothetical protein
MRTNRKKSMQLTTGNRLQRSKALVAGLVSLALTSTMQLTVAQEAAYQATSQNGLYTLELTPELVPLAINTMHNWSIVVAGADGVPVDDATIAVDGGMPAHGHGLPTAPQVTQALGAGQYLLEGVKFNMSGDWVLNVSVTAAAGTDRATIQVPL